MSRLKVLATHPLIPGGLDLLARHDEVTVANGLDSPEELKQAVRGLDALIPLLSVPVTAEVLDAADELKVVANYAVGFDNVDIPAATRRGIYVTNTPGVLTEATADLTWALLLSLARQVIPGHQKMLAGGFSGWGPTLLMGTDLCNKTLGVVGFGQIGQAVARRAMGFSMRVLYHDPAIQGQVEQGGIMAEGVDLETLLRRSDVVSLHVPLTPQTRHLMDSERLGLMKHSALLINTARGPIIDEEALVEHLRNRRLAGAGLDVFENEPAMAPGLRRLDNVVLLPHLGSATTGTRLAMARLAAENVHAALQGQVPPNALNNP